MAIWPFRARRRHAAALPVITLLAAALAPQAHAAPAEGHAARAAAPTRTSVNLPIPKAGDVSYAIVQVRVSGRRAATARGKKRVYKGSVGGLKIAAESRAWRKLRKSTRFHVIASNVAGAPKSVRNVVLVATRRGGGPAGKGSIKVTLGNARADVSSHWVRSVNRRGVADVFTARNVLSTATANWARYLTALRAAKAFKAAANPVDVNGTFAPKARAAAGKGRLWTGGSKMTPLGRKMFGLIFGTMDDRMAFQAAKKSPLAATYIATELRNPKLAATWTKIVSVLPLAVPDQYAAAAKEEARFTKIGKAKISRRKVLIADNPNAADFIEDEVSADGVSIPTPSEVVRVSMNAARGTIASQPAGIDCGDDCRQEYSSGQTVTLVATPAAGYTVASWRGCTRSQANVCSIDVTATEPEQRRSIFVTFEPVAAPTAPPAAHPASKLTTVVKGAGAGKLVSAPEGIACPTTCGWEFAKDQTVTLTAIPVDGSELTLWDGCDTHTATTCTVKMTGARTVQAAFEAVSGPREWQFANVIGGFAAPPHGAFAAGPQGVSAAQHAVFVADTANAQIRSFAPDGTPLNTFGQLGSGDGEINTPRQAAVDPHTGHIYVSDTWNLRVQEWTPSGQYVRTFPHTFGIPRGIAVSPTTGVVAVADAGNDEVVQFVVSDTGAELAHTIRAGGDTDFTLHGPEAVAFDPDGNLWVADSQAQQVVEFDDAGTFLRKWTHERIVGPLGIAADDQGNVVVASFGNFGDTSKSSLDVFTVDGVHRQQLAGPGHDPGQVAHPVGAAVDPDSGDVYVADEYNNRVQRFTPGG